MITSPANVCFVIMPFGSGSVAQINKARFETVLQPAILKAHTPFRVIRADEEALPGSITDQIIKRLVESELVIADLKDLNPNVFYELGIRHASRRGTILVAPSGQELPFDLHDLRVLRYVDAIGSHSTFIAELTGTIDAAMANEPDDTPVDLPSRNEERQILLAIATLINTGRIEIALAFLDSLSTRGHLLRAEGTCVAFYRAVVARLCGEGNARKLLELCIARAGAYAPYASLELAQHEFARASFDAASELVDRVKLSDSLSLGYRAMVLEGMCQLSNGHRVAPALLDGVARPAVGVSNEVRLASALHAGTLLLSEGRLDEAEKRWDTLRRANVANASDHRLPYIPLTKDFDQGVIDLLIIPTPRSAEAREKTLRLVSRVTTLGLRGVGHAIAQTASVLRRTRSALCGLEELGKLRHWRDPPSVDGLNSRLRTLEKEVLATAGTLF